MTSIFRLSGLLAAMLAIFPMATMAQSAESPSAQKAVPVTGDSSAKAADDVDALTAMLNRFLAAADKREAHEVFWADELVYTSSNGTRFGKAEILAGFDEADEADEADNQGPKMTYTGEDVNVQLFGATAVVTFRLVGTPDDDSGVKSYFNTGTFLKRNGQWRAVAWQATVIPGG